MEKTHLLDEKEIELVKYIESEVEKGNVFFKSKSISERIDMTPQEIGANLVRLSEKYDGLSIEKWSTSNATTWMIKRVHPFKSGQEEKEHA